MPRRNPNRTTSINERTAARIRAEREAAAWSIYVLAARLSELGCPMNPTSIYKIEREQRDVRVDEGVAFAEAFGVSFTSLLFEPFDPVDAAKRRCERIMQGARE